MADWTDNAAWLWHKFTWVGPKQTSLSTATEKFAKFDEQDTWWHAKKTAWLSAEPNGNPTESHSHYCCRHWPRTRADSSQDIRVTHHQKLVVAVTLFTCTTHPDALHTICPANCPLRLLQSQWILKPRQLTQAQQLATQTRPPQHWAVLACHSC